MNKKHFILAFLFAINCNSFYAQNSSKSKVALIEIDSKGLSINPDDMPITEITRLELEKISIYSLIDHYDLEYLYAKDNIKYEKCFSTYCIAEIAQKLKCDKVFTGSISKVADRMVVHFKVYDVKSNEFDRELVKEFLNLPLSIPAMIRITLNEMYSLPNNQDEINTLTRNFIFDESRNNPYKNRLRADGPRMGMTLFTGNTASILSMEKKSGGYKAMPLMFQFGYQFEKQYLNQGNFQALFEVVPMITGLDQGLCIPSLTLLNGMRNNHNGWEFAFGPSLSVVNMAKGFYDKDNNWHLESEAAGLTNKPFFETRLDSRGSMQIHPSFIFVLGKTFKSGKLNIPVNAYFVPSSEGYRMGVSFGFNSRARYENNVIKN